MKGKNLEFSGLFFHAGEEYFRKNLPAWSVQEDARTIGNWGY
jgi:hypothetical protein